MLRRPKPGEDDLEAMMKEFQKSGKSKPAASIIKKRRPNPALPGHSDRELEQPKKPKSVFAQRRQEQIKKIADADTPEKVVTSVLTEIVERDVINAPLPPSLLSSQTGFPEVLKMDSIQKNKNMNKRTLFYEQFQKMKSELSMDCSDGSLNYDRKLAKESVESHENDVSSDVASLLGDKSFILTGIGLDNREDIDQLHIENINKLQMMSEGEILEEQQKLMQSLDPKLIEFVASRRPVKKNIDVINKVSQGRKLTNLRSSEAVHQIFPDNDLTGNQVKSILKEEDSTSQNIENEELFGKYLNMDIDEPEKREWMKELPEFPVDDNEYSARFGFDGALLHPENKLGVESGLYHHGEEAERPGYTLSELLTLIRSSNSRQRVVALNTMSALLNKYWSGVYDDCFGLNLLEELIKSGLVSLLRCCLDEKEESVIFSGTECLASLMSPQGEESGLDLVSVFTPESPELAPTLDTDVTQQEKQLKDHELVQLDMVAGLLRMDILLRIRYILAVLKPGPGVVLACLKILICIARHSESTACHILQCPSLLPTIITHFLPPVIPQQYSKTSLYGLPVYLACKLCRIIASWNFDLARRIILEIPIERSLMVYLTIDPSEACIPVRESILLCIESFRCWNIFLRYNLSTQTYSNIYPLLMRLLLYFVNNVDIVPAVADKKMFDYDVGTWLLIILGTALGCEIALQDLIGLYDPVSTCIRKWLVQISRCNDLLCNSLHNMLAAALSFLANFISKLKVEDKDGREHWKKKIYQVRAPIITFLTSKYGKLLFNILHEQSAYLSHETRESRSVSCQPQAGAVLHKAAVHPILSPASPIYVLSQLLRVCSVSRDFGVDFVPASQIFKSMNPIYLQSLMRQNLSLISNWFSRFEARLLFWFVMSCKDAVEFRSEIHMLAVVVCGILQRPDEILVRDLMDLIVFNPGFFDADYLMTHFLDNMDISEIYPVNSASRNLNENPGLAKIIDKSVQNLESVKSTYLLKLLNEEQCRHSLSLHGNKNSNVISLAIQTETVLSQDWQCYPLLENYNLEQSGKKLISARLSDVVDCLSWLIISNSSKFYNKDEMTARYFHLATVFLAGNDIFLDSDVHTLLSTLLNRLLASGIPDLTYSIPGITSGLDFFLQLLDQFQAVSYGDELFAMFLCIPLAMTQPPEYRKALWIERQELVKSVTLKSENFGSAVSDKFMYPHESDLVLIVAYFQAVQLGYIHKKIQSFMYSFVVNHVKHFLKEDTSDDERIRFKKHVMETASGDFRLDLEIL